MSPEQQENLRVYSVEGETARELNWKPFSPDNPLKFAPDVAGVVISHSSNRLDSAAACVVRVVFGIDDQTLEMEKEVKPANAAPENRQATAQSPYARPAALAVPGAALDVHLHVLDHKAGKWVPLTCDAELSPDGMKLLLKEKE